MAVERHFRKPCAGCGDAPSKHRGRGSTRLGPCHAAGCNCQAWEAQPGDWGVWRARHVGPDRRERVRHFQRKPDAERWLDEQCAAVRRGAWADPAKGRVRFGDWLETWERTAVDLRASTRARDASYFRSLILPHVQASAARRDRPARGTGVGCLMPAAYEKAARAQGQRLHLRVINTLPKQDPEGVVPGLVVFVLLVAGYLGSTLAMHAPAPRQPAVASPV